MFPTPEQIQSYIQQGIACSHLTVEGDGQHFYATVVSAEFEGKRLIQRHQLVYAALGDRMKAEVHALSIKALTPAEFAEKAGQ
ncbi:BolA family protein [Polynucleobacter difficilis]|jgi:acid stress-induced BolA-like protein IbaG/YrbA|uniref:BolA family protein n=1 Tax=Polynucleobacter difficilis TaxID=556054 RepID=UPI000D3C6F3C|nr:BolA family protein [Polynucleobacter difficilis]